MTIVLRVEINNRYNESVEAIARRVETMLTSDTGDTFPMEDVSVSFEAEIE